jgi:PREDICTED: protein enabled homolog
MDFNDYYDILEIDDSAAESEIKVAIRKTRSRYRNLTGSPNKDQARKAEHMIDVLAEAEKVLYDPAARADYDQKLAIYRTKKILNNDEREEPSPSEEEIRREYELRLEKEWQRRERKLRDEYKKHKEERHDDSIIEEDISDDEFLDRYEERLERARQERAAREERERQERLERERQARAERERLHKLAQEKRAKEEAARWEKQVTSYLEDQNRDYKALHYAAQQLTSYNPRSAIGWQALAMAQYDRGEFPAAATSIRQAKQLSSTPSDDLLSLEALIAVKNGNYTQALANYRHLIQEYPDNQKYIAQYIQALTVSGDPQHAVSESEQALAVHPDSSEIKKQYAVSLMREAQSYSIPYNGLLYVASRQQLKNARKAFAKVPKPHTLPEDIRPIYHQVADHMKIATKRRWTGNFRLMFLYFFFLGGAMVFMPLMTLMALVDSISKFYSDIYGFLADIIIAFIGMGISVPVWWLFFYCFYQPMWRHNRRWLSSIGVAVPR